MATFRQSYLVDKVLAVSSKCVTSSHRFSIVANGHQHPIIEMGIGTSLFSGEWVQSTSVPTDALKFPLFCYLFSVFNGGVAQLRVCLRDLILSSCSCQFWALYVRREEGNLGRLELSLLLQGFSTEQNEDIYLGNPPPRASGTYEPSPLARLCMKPQKRKSPFSS